MPHHLSPEFEPFVHELCEGYSPPEKLGEVVLKATGLPPLTEDEQLAFYLEYED